MATPSRRAPVGQKGLPRQDLPANASEGETAGAAPHDSGDTAAIRNEHPSYRLPHQRDESTSTQAGRPGPTQQQAHADAENGLEDTSRAETTDETYAREFRADPASTPAKRRAPPGERH
jgi:hypothetical protein